jgi:hypothetical protein
MAHAFYHARSSARKFGGIPEDYYDLHEFMDSTKQHVPDARHRLFLHNAWGIWLAERALGTLLTRGSDNHVLPTRTILEQHVKEDFGGVIPTLDQCFERASSLPLLEKDDDWQHCLHSCERYGGEPEDYLPLHRFLNSARTVLPDEASRCVLHNAWGIDLAVHCLGIAWRRSSDHIQISTRSVAETHLLRDLGTIPTMLEAVRTVPLATWMYESALPLSRLLKGETERHDVSV